MKRFLSPRLRKVEGKIRPTEPATAFVQPQRTVTKRAFTTGNNKACTKLNMLKVYKLGRKQTRFVVRMAESTPFDTVVLVASCTASTSPCRNISSTQLVPLMHTLLRVPETCSRRIRTTLCVKQQTVVRSRKRRVVTRHSCTPTWATKVPLLPTE